jgi:CspA family cold shock protein
MRATPLPFLTTPTELVVGGISCRIGLVGVDLYAMEFTKIVDTTSNERTQGSSETRGAVYHRFETKASSLDNACQIATGLAQRLDAALAGKQSFRITGRVKWWSDAKGYGFIIPDSGAEDVFIHFSELVMKGFKSVSEGERVSFEVKPAKFGPSGGQVARVNHSEDFASLTQLGFHPENIALALVDGSIRVIAVAPDGRWHLLDDVDRRHALLYVWSLESSLYRTAVEELEALINDPHVREADLHDFFERHPDFILNDDYRAAHSKVVLESDEGPLIPDFLLEPATSNLLCDLLELKLPDVSIDVTKPRRVRFSAAVAEACAQLRTYRDFFEETRNRERF